MNNRERLLGAGSFSRVYRIWDERDGIFYACKIMESRELAEREAHFLGQMQTPLFPIYKGYYEEAHRYYLVMEYICGCSLRDFVEKRGPLKERSAVRITEALAKGLLPLHERTEPILYRDLKPENVMICQDGGVRLVDVGCACYLSDVRRTKAGSPGYAAPEQFSEEGCPGPESDVYGMGQLLYYMLSGGDQISRKRGIGMQSVSASRKLRDIMERTVTVCQRGRIPDMRTLLAELNAGEYRREAFYYEKNVTDLVCKERAPQVR